MSKKTRKSKSNYNDFKKNQNNSLDKENCKEQEMKQDIISEQDEGIKEKINSNQVYENGNEQKIEFKKNIEDINKAKDEDINDINDIDNEEFTKLKNEFEEMKILAQRTQADFMNYKKRVEKEKGQLTIYANEVIMTEMLSIIDNFERAINSEKENTDTPFYKGVELILKQFIDTLSKYGLEEIKALKESFDPNFHHAVLQEDSDEPDKVIEVLQKGYKLKDKVIRPSMVKVGK